jgi:tripartite-type tricarboxylate transporter receptor subunit TctC
VCEELGNRLGHRFVVENQPGASGRLGVQALARSSPDGYTFGIVATSTNAVSAAVNPTLPYDPVKSFAAVSLIGNSPYVSPNWLRWPRQSLVKFVTARSARSRSPILPELGSARSLT